MTENPLTPLMRTVRDSKLAHHPQSLSSPQCPLALQQVLQAQEPFFPLWPVWTSTVVENFCYILGLPQIMGNAPIPGTIWALRANTRGITVGIIVRIHPIWLVSPPHRLLLPGRTRDGGDRGRSGKMKWPWVVPNKTTTTKELCVKRYTHRCGCTTPALFTD